MATKPSGKKPAPSEAPNTKTPAAPKPGAAGASAPAKKTRKKPQAKPRQRAASTPKAKEQPSIAPLTPKQQRFVDEYMIDLNGTQAAIRAGYSPDTASEISWENLRKPQIQRQITAARLAQQERTQVTADRWLMEVAHIALADSRELVEVKSGCCRCCHGENHKYQRTVSEMNRDREAWSEKGKNPAEFDEAGGIGFNPLLPAAEQCPVCGGDGAPRVVLKDTRRLSTQAVALYAGAKQTQYGIEIKMHSKTDALEKLAKHLGVYEKDNAQKTDPLAVLLERIASGNGNGFKPVAVDPERKSSIGPSAASDDEDD